MEKEEIILNNKMDLKIKDRLLELYADKKIVGIYKIKEVDKLINTRRAFYGLSKREYLNILGFEFSEGWGVKINEENIDLFLEEYYPNKIISSLSDLSKKKQKVYNHINEYCIKNNMDSIEYLNNKGYKIIKDENYYTYSQNSETKTSSSLIVDNELSLNKYNIISIINLIESYDLKKAELAEWLGVRRQAIDALLSRKTKYNNFQGEKLYFEPEIEEIICDFIKKLETEYSNKELQLKIYFEKNRAGVAIFYKYKNEIKCIFNPTGKVGEKIKEYEYGKYNNYDFELLRKMQNENVCQYIKRWNEDASKVKIIDNKIEKLININSRRCGIDKAEYLDFLGVKIYTYSDEVEDRLYNIFKINRNKEGIVKLENKSEDGKQSSQYVKVQRDLKTLNISMEDLAEKFGFIYKRIVNLEVYENKDKEIIKNRYVVRNSSIYINSQDKYCINLRSRASQRGMKFDEYIQLLGFIRIKSKDELPIGYIEYDWRRDIVEISFIEQKLKNILKDIAFENQDIYIDTDTYLYDLLLRYSYILNVNINEMIENFGFKRIYKRKNVSNKEDKINNHDEEKYKEELRNNILEELKNMDNSLKKNGKFITTIERNIKLPRLLKELYEHKCQLCSEQTLAIPPIKKENGEEYVEVHHIKELASGFNENNECDEDLDSYKNAIVVCCYHHKYLHLHNGGSNEMIKKDNKLFLKSKMGDLVEVVTNHHLKI